MTELHALSNDQLISSFKSLKEREDAVLVEVLEHILEFERRRLYLSLGYTSLFGYLTQGLGYSENESYRRVESSRLMAGMPEIKDDIAKGRLTLTNMTEVRTAIKAKYKSTGQSVSKAERRRLVTSVLDCSKKEAQKKIANAIPEIADSFQEKRRELGDGSLELTVLLRPPQRSRLERARDLLAHKGPMQNTAETIDRLSEFYLKKKDLTQGFDPSIESVRQAEQQELLSKDSQSPIPAAIRRAVFKRDQGRCQFALPFGRICGSTYRVEIDHIQARSAGGKSVLENLRCLCRAHNQWKADGPAENAAKPV